MPDDRTYIKVHDGMPDHPKIEPLSDGAFRLLMSGWCWCSRHLTDGFMPAAVWVKRGTPKTRRELLAVGLVVDHGPKVEFHDYCEHQRTAEKVAAMKEQRRTAGRRGGQARAKRLAKQTASESLGESSSKTQAETEGTSVEVPQTDTSGGGGDKPPPLRVVGDKIDPGAVVGAFVEAATKAGQDRPGRSIIGRIGKSAKQLLADGTTPADVLTAARRLGANGWDDLEREVRRVQTERRPAASMDYVEVAVRTDW